MESPQYRHYSRGTEEDGDGGGEGEGCGHIFKALSLDLTTPERGE
jgi:hypothetical protein